MGVNGRMILEIGCGKYKVYGQSLGLDIRKTTKTDIVADARTLPFEDGVFDLIFSSHNIEHISHREVRSTLAEWIRVLRPGGGIEIICPDLRARAAIFAARPTWDGVMKIYGDQDYPENSHLSGYSYGLLKEILISLGIGRIKRIIRGYKGIPFIPNSLHLVGEKKGLSQRRVEARRKSS